MWTIVEHRRVRKANRIPSSGKTLMRIRDVEGYRNRFPVRRASGTSRAFVTNHAAGEEGGDADQSWLGRWMSRHLQNQEAGNPRRTGNTRYVIEGGKRDGKSVASREHAWKYPSASPSARSASFRSSARMNSPGAPAFPSPQYRPLKTAAYGLA